MTTAQKLTANFTLRLSEEERAQLLVWLERRRREKLIEEHCTDAITYREYVLHEEAILESVISKLRAGA